MVTKKCSKCGEVRQLAEFYLSNKAIDGHRSECKVCSWETTKRWREKNPGKMRAYKEANPEKVRASWAVKNALRDKRLTRKPCEVCGAEKTDAHHEDYEKKLEVVWLCRKHHQEKHLVA